MPPLIHKNHFGTFLAVAILGVVGSLHILPDGLVATLLAGILFSRFVVEIDEGVPIEIITGLIAALQWVLAPALAYAMEIEGDRYTMYVESREYFGFATPATAAFICGLLVFSGRGREASVLWRRDRRHDFQTGLALLAVAVVADLARSFAPSGLAFFLHIASQLRYIAVVYFLFSGHRYRWLLAVLSVAQLFTRSAESAMFHDLILWLALLTCYWWLLKRRSLAEKILMLAVGFLFVGIIQVVKRDYREAVWSGQRVSIVEMVYDMIVERAVWTHADVVESAVVRMNQGWIISAVLRHVPLREPFAGGETVRDAIEAAALPRFLAPNKKKAGGQENFRRFTGLPLHDSTSMGISPLGEAYANFGVGGGIGFMLVWGLAFGMGVGTVRRYGERDPAFLLWIPLIFYQSIKAETEIVVVLNQLVKGGVVAAACHYGIHYLWLRNAGLRLGLPGEFEPIRTGARLADIQRH